jgi:hypothetical protein
MKIIKVSSGSEEYSNLLLRQTVGMRGIWGDCKFLVNQKVDYCDWWVVCHFSGLLKPEETFCDPNHLIYISMEPKEYFTTEKYLNQFSKLVLCDREIKHPNIYYRNGLTWWVGLNVEHKILHHFSKTFKFDYDSFSTMQPPVKNKLMSIVSSKNNNFPGHGKRLAFLEKLKNHSIGKYIDIYGGGFNPILDKWIAIEPYKYSIVLENSAIRDYWTEKLGDSFLGYSFPIYYGCPNINDYFPVNSLEIIDIDDFERAVKIIQKIIDEDPYNDKIEYINEARHSILNRYNIFQLMGNLCNEYAEKHVKCRLNSASYYIGPLWKRLARKIKYAHL